MVYSDVVEVPPEQSSKNYCCPTAAIDVPSLIVVNEPIGGDKVGSADDCPDDGLDLLSVEPVINRERRVSAVLSGRPPADELAVALTDRLHRPECAVSFALDFCFTEMVAATPYTFFVKSLFRQCFTSYGYLYL